MKTNSNKCVLMHSNFRPCGEKIHVLEVTSLLISSLLLRVFCSDNGRESTCNQLVWCSQSGGKTAGAEH